MASPGPISGALDCGLGSHSHPVCNKRVGPSDRKGRSTALSSFNSSGSVHRQLDGQRRFQRPERNARWVEYRLLVQLPIAELPPGWRDICWSGPLVKHYRGLLAGDSGIWLDEFDREHVEIARPYHAESRSLCTESYTDLGEPELPVSTGCIQRPQLCLVRWSQ